MSMPSVVPDSRPSGDLSLVPPRVTQTPYYHWCYFPADGHRGRASNPIGDQLVEFRILGPLEVWDADEQVEVGGPKQRRVLAALALEPGRVVPVERLVDAVWDDAPPPTARRQIQNAVSALRQT